MRALGLLTRERKSTLLNGITSERYSNMKHYTNKELWDSISSQNRSIIASRTEYGSNPDIYLSWYGIPPSRQDAYAKAIKPADVINMGLARGK